MLEWNSEHETNERYQKIKGENQQKSLERQEVPS